MARRCALTLVLVVAVTAMAWAAPPVLQPRAQLLMKPLSLGDTFKNLLVRQKLTPDKQDVALKQFQALPADLQHVLLTAMDQQYGAQFYSPAYKAVLLRPGAVFVLKPRITSCWPTYGAPPDAWVVVMGTALQATDKVLWDGVERPTTYYGPDVEFFPNSLCFQIPAGTPLATSHEVKVRRSATNESSAYSYRCCATRGYRGIYGWKFANFGNPLIPWHLYRDFFGQSAVEYPNGAHRPAAQSWYDSAYKGVGGGGNCYGMSNSSLRLRNGNMTTYHHAWFTSHPQPFCWFYDWCNETKESVQEDQGGQLSAEMAATINDLWNNQDHKEAWDRINSLIYEAINRPVVGFWYVGHWGHAVVPYSTAISGSQHRIIWYDNNEPYAENESGGPDKSTAYVDWNNSSFHANSYGTANKMVCMSYNECMRPPHLPTAAGGPGASATGTVVAVVEGGSVQQIEDEGGRQFYGAGGAENTDPNTRIPNSMRYVPVQAAGQEYTGPAIFIFSNATNKNLTFTVAGGGPKRLSFFQPGSVFRAEFAGQGQLRLNRILTPTRSLELPSPPALQPSQIHVIHVQAAERVYNLQGLNLGAGAAQVSIIDDNQLQVQTGTAGLFDLRVETFANGQVGQALFRGIATQANSRAQLAPSDWNNLPGTSLNLNLRFLNNQQIQQRRIDQ